MTLEPIRCPRCHKAFLTAASERELSSDVHFLCQSCSYEFSAEEFSDQDPGATEEGPLAALTLSGPCPFCGQKVSDLDEECPHCQKIPAKYQYWQLKKNLSVSHQKNRPGDGKINAEPFSETIYRSLMDLWRLVVENFEDPSYHYNFLKVVSETKQWDFAEERYLHLKSLIGVDPEIEKRLLQIQLERTKNNETETAKEKRQRWLRRRNQVLIFGVAALLFLLALALPSGRELFALGFFVLACGLLYGIHQ